MNEKLEMLAREQKKGEANLAAANTSRSESVEHVEKPTVPELLRKARQLAKKLLGKFDPTVPHLDAQLMLSPEHHERSFELLLHLSLSDDETLLVYINIFANTSGSGSNMSVAQFNVMETTVPIYRVTNTLKQAQRLTTYMFIFPVERARTFRFGENGSITRKRDEMDNDAGLLKMIEDHINDNWEIIKQSSEDADPQRPK